MTLTEGRVYKEFGVSPNEVVSLLDAFNELLKTVKGHLQGRRIVRYRLSDCTSR